MGINVLLVAPVTLSTAGLFYETSELQYGFSFCYFVVGIFDFVSFVICLLIGISYNGTPIATLRKECKNYYTAMVLLITSSLLQIIIWGIVGVFQFLYRLRAQLRARYGNQLAAPFDTRQGIMTAGIVPYAVAILALVLIERLDTFTQLTWDNADQGWDALGFGQIFAVVTSVAPFIEVVKYLFRKQPERLSGLSPMGYLFRAKNFNFRKPPHSSKSSIL